MINLSCMLFIIIKTFGFAYAELVKSSIIYDWTEDGMHVFLMYSRIFHQVSTISLWQALLGIPKILLKAGD